MNTRRHAAPSPSIKTTVTTLGDLIAAAYDVSEGSGLERAERAARLLTASLRAGRCGRRLRFVR
jgi:hypothetical protein